MNDMGRWQLVGILWLHSFELLMFSLISTYFVGKSSQLLVCIDKYKSVFFSIFYVFTTIATTITTTYNNAISYQQINIHIINVYSQLISHKQISIHN